jgi:formamidopyrimidine-DNA glycosylase
VPELPEVEALSRFLRERLVGRVVARVDVDVEELAVPPDVGHRQTPQP